MAGARHRSPEHRVRVALAAKGTGMIRIEPYEGDCLPGYHVSRDDGRRFAGAYHNVARLYKYNRDYSKVIHLQRPVANKAQAISLAHRWCQGYDV